MPGSEAAPMRSSPKFVPARGLPGSIETCFHRALWLGLVCVLSGGCSPKQQDLLGVYVSGTEAFTDTLELLPDGVMRQHVVVGAGASHRRATGSWRLIVHSPMSRYVLIRNGIVVSESKSSESGVEISVGGRALALGGWEFDHGLGSSESEGHRYRRLRKLTGSDR